MVDVSVISGAITLAVVSLVAIIDYRRFRIPNAITIPFAVTGLYYHSLNQGLQGFLISLAGLILGVLLLIAPYLLRGFGGGDVKLLGAMGAWLGANELIRVFIVSAVLLGLVSLILICRSSSVRRAAILNLKLGMLQLRGLGCLLGGEDRVEEVVLREDRRKRAVPFGAVLSIGLTVVLVWKFLVVGGN